MMAVREGFEPSIRLQTVYSLSRGAPSAARPPHQQNGHNDNKLSKNLKLFLTLITKIHHINEINNTNSPVIHLLLRQSSPNSSGSSDYHLLHDHRLHDHALS